MHFSDRKLPAEAVKNLRAWSISSVTPYSLMLAPVYVFFRTNQKFVSIRGPLDFFTPEDLVRLEPYENLYVSRFMDRLKPIRDVATQVRALLEWTPKDADKELLPPAPYEISDGVMRLVGRLWSPELSIEPYAVTVFAETLCNPLDPESLVAARDRDVVRFEQAITRSAWSVFMALHLGHCELAFLNRLRLRAFEQFAREGHAGGGEASDELSELLHLAETWVQNADDPAVSRELLRLSSRKTALKLTERLRRVESQVQSSPQPKALPSLFGPEGLIHV